MNDFFNPLKNDKTYKEIENFMSSKKGSCSIHGLNEVSKAHFSSVFLSEKYKKKLILTYDEIKAKSLYESILNFNKKAYLLYEKDILFFFEISNNNLLKNRVNLLKEYLENENIFLISSISNLLEKFPSFSYLQKNIRTFKTGDILNLENLFSFLVDNSYKRVKEVENLFEFSNKGAIIDIFLPNYSYPIRIELWDDEIDTIRYFDIETKRSLENLEEIKIYPSKNESNKTSLLEYFTNEDSLIFLDEADLLIDKLTKHENDFIETREKYKNELGIFKTEEIIKTLREKDLICLNLLKKNNSIFNSLMNFKIETTSIISYFNSFNQLIRDLLEYKKEDNKVLIFTPSRTRAKRLATSLNAYGLNSFFSENTIEDIKEKDIVISLGNLKTGFSYPKVSFVLISETDIYNVKEDKKKIKVKDNTKKNINLNELKVGDYIVHEELGIGIYRGIENIERNSIIKSYIKLQYADNANFYMPVTKLNLLQKYGIYDKKIKLSKLASLEWQNTKAKVKKAVESVAKYLVELYAKRLNSKGYKYSKDTIWQEEFEELFPFTETNDQLLAINTIKNELENGKIIDRLICGDVGYGKTEIALRIAFKVVMESKQVIYLAPTTILARQHFNSFMERMKSFPINIEMLSRFITPKKQTEIIEKFNKGKVDILIGTTKVLSKNIKAKDLGLLIIDEEQRFGVKDKEKIKQFKENVNVINLTATPIPRTLHMSLIGVRDLSILKEAPMDRQAVETYVLEENDFIIERAIKKELEREGQVYYVYNKTNDIYKTKDKIQKLVPNSRIGVAFSKMSKIELENIMLSFINREIDILISTSIIETGLDIPNANTIIIEDADKFGLSQLYQLRGRVGRSYKIAYAFMLYKKNKILKEEASKRLKAIEEFKDLGSGIKIAKKDLEIRGAGTLLGETQHGHINLVGYDLYRKLLSKAIQGLKNENINENIFDTVIDVDINAYIPKEYIHNESIRLDIYKKISEINSKEDYLDILDEIVDRFGTYPKEIENLIEIAYIKQLANKLYIEELSIKEKISKLHFLKNFKINPNKLIELINKYKNIITLSKSENIVLNIKDNKKISLEFIKEILEFLSE